MPPARPLLLLSAAALLAGCGVTDETPLPDNALLNETGAGADARALGEAIRVDPRRAAPDRPPERVAKTVGGCADRVRPGAGWVRRLPAAFPVYPGARLVEAGGADGDCTLRVATFRTTDPRPAVLGWYARRAKAAGYSTDTEDRGAERLLGGTRGNLAYAVIARVAGGGTEVDLMANGGA